MSKWREQLKIDPVPVLLSCEDAALKYFVRRDILGEKVESTDFLRQLPEVQKIFRKQQIDGSWLYHGAKKHKAINYGLIETWKQFRFIVEKYGLGKDDPSTQKAAEFLFSYQTEDGDFRGFLANQYATYYTGAIMSLLIKAGYENDPRIEKGFQWLLSMRQNDSGWSIPILTHNFDGKTMYRLTSEYAEPVEPDRTKPFSHNWTGMVLRAFAAHSRYRKSKEAKNAANLLKSRFFQSDCYSSYKSASYWVRFQYPFWWNNLVTALDSVTLIDTKMDEPMEKALNWLIDHQRKDGSWNDNYVNGEEKETAKTKDARVWVTLAICRIFKRLY